MRRLVLAIALVLSQLPAALLASDAPKVDLHALAAAGKKTLLRVRSSPVQWTVTGTLSNGNELEAAILNDGDKSRTVVTAVRGTNRLEILRVISRDKLWYVTDRNGSGKYRPYEAPLEFPFIYTLLDLSQPRVITSPDEISINDVESVDGDVAVLRQPLAKVERKQLSAALDLLGTVAANTGESSPAQTQLIKDLLASGNAMRINLSTGQLLEFGNAVLKLREKAFDFSPNQSSEDFAVDGKNWDDYSDDPTNGNLDNLIMIMHQPGIKAGAKNYSLDGRLMDVETGRFRRIPFPGGPVVPGCFLKDRRSAVVAGGGTEGGLLRPYRIDLSTRKCEPIGSPLLDTGATLGGDLSPDGKTIVATHIDPAAGLPNGQVCLIDVATGRAKPIGKPMDTFFTNWTADGQHLVLLSRKNVGWLVPPAATLAIMDMDGKLTELRKGDQPVLLADRRTILFQDPDSDLWQTCDLEGQNVKPFGDGLKGYGFPAPAPDGKRILMMHFIPNELPEPIVLSIGASTGRVITKADGLWGGPVWR